MSTTNLTFFEETKNDVTAPYMVFDGLHVFGVRGTKKHILTKCPLVRLWVCDSVCLSVYDKTFVDTLSQQLMYGI